ncbi:MAG: pyruvate formate-lyase [Ruminococcaceae bacterium]|nr:pyruvate formate-lyase [Oscillospiraceae bacterium]
MTERIKKLKEYFVEEKKHHSLRRNVKYDSGIIDAIEKEAPHRAMAMLFCAVIDSEEPFVYEFERIPFTRSVKNIPYEALDPFIRRKKIHEKGIINNICVDYSLLMSKGFDKAIKELEFDEKRYSALGEIKKCEYLSSCIMVLKAILGLCKRYREKAREIGNYHVYNMLGKIPRNAPEGFEEALCFFRIVHFAMWASGSNHNTVGRFDLYMKSYYESSIKKGELTKEEAFELLEEFFLTFNRDSDLYPGVQMGDNGQSLVLGGIDEEGNEVFSELSELCLRASCELGVIDPKINLRVSKNTSEKVYVLGSELTRKGLGFPQYTNDDVVIPALLDWGYELKDARNYALAACWEIIIPGKGADIPNVDALSFALCCERAIKKNLQNAETFEEIVEYTKKEIKGELESIISNTKGIYILPNPLLSLMSNALWEQGVDITEGARYKNFGIHGAGLSTAVDSLAALKEKVYDKKVYSRKEVLSALEANYEGYDEMYHDLRYNSAKLGNNDEFVNDIASMLLEHFAKVLSNYKNDRGGIFRAGTGSAMYYILHAKKIGATPDGRKAGEPHAANYSPSLYVRCKGPVSVILSFTSPKLSQVSNGGPLTLELHSSMFRTNESLLKTAMLVKSFILRGGHQLQLNAINREVLLDAQKHPENHKNLIVRVWGWSGYFVELDKVYQDHIIARCEYVVR